MPVSQGGTEILQKSCKNLADTGKHFPLYVSFRSSEDPVPHFYVITDKTVPLLKCRIKLRKLNLGSIINQFILLRELNNEGRPVLKC